MAATLQVQDTINFAQPFMGFYPLSVGANMQPAVHIANSIKQAILAPPFKWRWNRGTINWIATAGVQSYMPAGAWASGAYTAGTVIIDSNGNGEKVISAGTSGGSAPTWATGLFAATTDGGVTWQNLGALASIPQLSDFGFIEKAQVQDINVSPAQWKEIQPRLDLSRDSGTSCPKQISAQSDDNAGNLSFRLMPVPGSLYPISVQYQKQATLITGLTSLWAIPDYMFEVYSWGFLALALLYKSDSRFPFAAQQFVSKLLAFAEGLTESDINIFLSTWSGITNSLELRAMKQNQGSQIRAQ